MCCSPQSRPGSPEGLKKAFNISEKQFFQVCLMALSLAQDWKSVDELVTTKVRQFLAQAHTLWSAQDVFVILLVFECCPCALESLLLLSFTWE